MRDRGLDPREPYPGARSPWHCVHLECGHDVYPRFDHVRAGGGGCIHCRSTRIWETRHGDAEEAIAVMRSHGFEPETPFPGTSRGWQAQCTSCGRVSSPQLRTIERGSGCRYCAGKAVNPVEAVQLAVTLLLIPLEPYPGYSAAWPCVCLTCDSTIDVRYQTLRYKMLRGSNTGCPHCVTDKRGRRIDPADAARELLEAGLEPLEEYPGAKARWRVRCIQFGHEGTTTRSTVRAGGGCAECARARRAIALRMPHDAAAAIMRAAGVEPIVPYTNSAARWLCRCTTCRNFVTPRLGNVSQGHGACRSCARGSMSGFPARLYLVVREELGIVKVGIARTDSDRVARWERRGWTLFRSWELNDGDDARAVEMHVLRYWRDDCGAPVAASERDMDAMAGWTETAPLWAVDLEATAALIEEQVRAKR